MLKVRSLVIALILLGICRPAFAQNGSDDVKQSADIVNNLDSLLNLWYVKTNAHAKSKHAENIYGFRPEEVPSYPDSVYIARINKIISPLPYTYNSKVKGFIDLYAVRKRQQVEKMLGLSEFYFPIFEETLDKYNMPLELKYLSVVESALNPRAVSHCGATGLWQFMYGTGVMYKLDVNSYVDERRNPYRSTEAAVLFLRDLHNVFGDWFLAIAAYNCGPGNVNKAIKRSGGKRTFWEIYNYLPAETRGYVPAFIAASYVFTYHREHNLYPQQISLPNRIDTVQVSNEISLQAIAGTLNVSLDLLRDLNPHFKKDLIPGKGTDYILRLPSRDAVAFASMKDSMYAAYYKQKYPIKPAQPNQQLANNSNPPKTGSGDVTYVDELDSTGTQKPSSTVPKVKVYYTVKSGDNMSMVADWFDVSIYSVRRWNGLKSNKLRVGQKLRIMVPQDKLAYYKKINTMTGLQKKKLIGTTAPETIAKTEPTKEAPVVTKKPNTTTSSTTNPNKYSYYVVQKGDTLWSISQRYPGVTVDQIKRSNGIADNRSLKAGQKIKIPKKG
jgi:membrane-bound lytic murein transglycosylase D